MGLNSATADSEKPIDAYLESPFVVADETGAITLDLLAGGEEAYDDTMLAMPALDDRTITVVVPDPPPLTERLAQDAQLEAQEPRNINENAACPTIFDATRSSRGARPDLGCNTSTGQRRSGALIPGPLRQSVATALQLALRSQSADGNVPSFEISEKAGRVVVNFTGGWQEFVNAQEAGPGLLGETLVRTVRSDQRAKSLLMELNGSCIDFALSLGGDMCGEARF